MIPELRASASKGLSAVAQLCASFGLHDLIESSQQGLDFPIFPEEERGLREVRSLPPRLPSTRESGNQGSCTGLPDHKADVPLQELFVVSAQEVRGGELVQPPFWQEQDAPSSDVSELSAETLMADV